MRIGIDARAAVEEKAGRGTLVRELIRSLHESSTEHEFILTGRERWDEPLDERFSWWLDGATVYALGLWGDRRRLHRLRRR